MTKRPQNVCKNCGYTWYPRGKSVSLKCPKCGSGKVSLAGGGLFAGILLLIGAGVLFGGHDKPRTEATNPAPSTVETTAPQSTPPDAPQAHSLPAVSPQPSVSVEEQTYSSAPTRQVFTQATATPQRKENDSAEEIQPSAIRAPSATCQKYEGSFISWNNCMWQECARPPFQALEECRNKQKN